jgi:hypothetical protein
MGRSRSDDDAGRTQNSNRKRQNKRVCTFRQTTQHHTNADNDTTPTTTTNTTTQQRHHNDNDNDSANDNNTHVEQLGPFHAQELDIALSRHSLGLVQQHHQQHHQRGRVEEKARTQTRAR